MNQLKLTLLKTDCQQTKYYDSTECVITRALKRTSKNWRHLGLGIVDVGSTSTVMHQGDGTNNLYTLNKLAIQMYNTCNDEGSIPEVEFILWWE